MREIVWHEEAEQACIGCCILSEKGLREVLSEVDEADFYRPAHRTLIKAISEMRSARQKVDLLTLKNYLEENGLLTSVGGPAYVISCAEMIPSTANALEYALIVRRDADARRVIQACEDAKGLITAEKLEDARMTLREAIRPKGAGSLTAIATVDMSKRVNGRRSCLNMVNVKTISEGWPCGQISLIGASSGGGKTALMVQDFIHAAAEQSERVIYATFGDLNAREIMARVMRQTMGSSIPPLNDMNLNAEWHKELSDWQNVFEADFYEARKIRDGDGRRVSVFCDTVRAAMDKAPIKRLYVDYIQKIWPDKPTGGMESDLRYVSDALQVLAEELQIAVIVGTQLTGGDEGVMPKGCRAVYEDCGIAVYIQWAHLVEIKSDIQVVYKYAKPTEEDNRVRLELRKNRFGRTGYCDAMWVPSHVAFEEVIVE